MLDAPYVGQRTHDVLRVFEWMKSLGHERIHLVASGCGCLPATFAAGLSSEVTRVTLKHAPMSYSEIAEAEEYAWPLSTFPPGILKQFDLPDCYRVLAENHLRLIEPGSPPAEGG